MHEYFVYASVEIELRNVCNYSKDLNSQETLDAFAQCSDCEFLTIAYVAFIGVSCHSDKT